MSLERGDIAQLGERGVRNAEVGGSSPPISTSNHSGPALNCPITPLVRSCDTLIGTQQCRMYPPVSRPKCGNICGNFVREGPHGTVGDAG